MSETVWQTHIGVKAFLNRCHRYLVCCVNATNKTASPRRHWQLKLLSSKEKCVDSCIAHSEQTMLKLSLTVYTSRNGSMRFDMGACRIGFNYCSTHFRQGFRLKGLMYVTDRHICLSAVKREAKLLEALSAVAWTMMCL